MALRRAARAVQAGDADVVACVAADTNHVDSFRQTLGSFSNFARDASYPYGSGGPNSIFAFITSNYMREFGATREDFGRIAVDQRSNALKNPNAMFKKPLTPRRVHGRAADLRPDPPVRLRDALRRCRGLPRDERGAGARARAAACAGARRDRAPQRVRRRSGDDARRLARRPRRALCAGRRAAEGHRFRADLRRLSGHRDDAVRGPRLLRQGRRAGVRAREPDDVRRQLSEQHQRRPVVGRAGRRGGWFSRHDGGDPPAHRCSRRARGAGCEARPRRRLRHGHLRPLPVHRRGDPREVQVADAAHSPPGGVPSEGADACH